MESTADSDRDWLLKPNDLSNEEVAAYWQKYNRVQSAIGGPVCPVCGKYLALHGDEHEFDDSVFT